MIRWSAFFFVLFAIVSAQAQTGGAFSPSSKSVRYADLQPGADMGAKINAALAKCPATGCTIDARGLTGAQTLTTAVTLTNAELLVGAANITQSATITLGQNGSIICQSTGFGQGNANGPSYFRMAAGVNLSNMLLASGSMTNVRDCVFDGDNNAWEGVADPTAGPLIAVSGSQWLLDHVTVQNGASDGIMIYSGINQTSTKYASGTNNYACCGTIRDVRSIFNGGDGFNCGGTADVIFEGSQAEGNGGNGVELNNCPTWRFTSYDIGGSQIGIYAHGAPYASGVAMSSNNTTIFSGQFGNQFKQDILIDSSSGGSINNQIDGAELYGSSNRVTGTYPLVEIIENGTGGNIVSGIGAVSTSTHQATNAVYIHGAATGSATATASWTNGGTISIGALTGSLVGGELVVDATTGYTVGIVSGYAGGVITLTSGASHASSGSADALNFVTPTGNDVVGPMIANGNYSSASVYNVPSGTALVSACASGLCQNTGQTIYGLSVVSAAASNYAFTAQTTGASGADQYGTLTSNPSTNGYASIEQDVTAGPSGNAANLSTFYCQRYNGNPGGTCFQYAYNVITGVKELNNIYGGGTPSLSGCGATSVKGRDAAGQFSLSGACTASTITLTFWGAAANGWVCPPLQDQTSGATFVLNGATTTTATFKGTGASGDVLTFGPCVPY
jgi:hypothetical protein